VEASPDPQGRIYSQTTDVWIGTNESRDRLVIYDGQTDEPILPDEERAEAAENRADLEKQRADILAAKLRELGIDPGSLK
ncbi:MAG: hypothetical protein GY795_06870, partial [Desulfobacterales bacterium]|nr:hypothetical protein [Desulfobacterales bacterium]